MERAVSKAQRDSLRCLVLGVRDSMNHWCWKSYTSLLSLHDLGDGGFKTEGEGHF